MAGQTFEDLLDLAAELRRRGHANAEAVCRIMGERAPAGIAIGPVFVEPAIDVGDGWPTARGLGRRAAADRIEVLLVGVGGSW